jgi:hypothetical protein
MDTNRQVQSESPISRIFGGRSRLTVRAPSQPDTVTIEAWRSLRLNIQVRFSHFELLPTTRTDVLETDSKPFAQPDSVHTVQDALTHISQPNPCRSASPAQARRASRCFSRRFHPFSSSILSASCMTRPRMAQIRSASQFSSAESRNPTRYSFLI